MARRKVVAVVEAPASAALASAREAVSAELARRQRLPRAVASLNETLFPAQRAFVEDPSSRVCTHTGRRGGKTWGLGARILRIANAFPGSVVPVFERTQTCESARVLWKTLHQLSDTFGLGAEFHNSRCIATLPNKTEIVIMGADTLEACDKARGGRYPAAFVDEAGTLRSHVLDYLLHEVLEHALRDFNGSLTMAGTPTTKCAGAFWKACQPGSGWSTHRWAFFDNDALPIRFRDGTLGVDHTAEERATERWAMYADRLARDGLSGSEAKVRREDWGEWHDDNESLVYRLAHYNYDPEWVKAPDLTKGRWRYLIGADVGWNDPCAFVVLAWQREHPEVWVVESEQHSEMLTDAIAAQLERLRARYGAHTPIVMDTGGHGGKLVEQTMLRKHGLRVTAARKRGKFDHIAFLNSDLVSGRLKLVQAANRDLIADLLQLRFAPPLLDGTVPDKEHPADDNHLPDALLYAATAVSGIRRGLADGDPAAKGSPAWVAQLEARMLEADLKSRAHRGMSTADEARRLLG